LFNLDEEGIYAIGVLKVNFQLGGNLCRVGSGFGDAVNDDLSH
jgi:hypothetical protein